ncbi:aryl-alcohol dehydrogenase-like predicted oxidoreductase [Microbacterium endophyticum]|uniref:Aryl-alcohol dehydrogenase-like predicted oxidoreductase n=1 Tax=Microbacterium endophyticum TaxID=1526412 RepID=A0A7W4V379_9MICO|nr:aldo/keto reductase [Microbacterium endophyticum]MBB2976048.1 aryl-alcohol dehydrogenase-like predicted oxidoreductase [Microbacterium endophyticum]NIK35033.1 aryl-alcohol dehydrogenase-like predicted oxidoreductase [Microbacterium endophyticum]
MGSSGTGTARAVVAPMHPHLSAPIPVQGPALGSHVRVPLGESSHVVFPLVLGGAEFGWNLNIDDSHAIIDEFVAIGGNALHTADSFVGGRSEHIIGQWVHTRGRRDDVVITTRVGAHPDNPGLGPVQLVRAVEASLMRLQTDHIDVLYLDGSVADAPLEETLATTEWLVESGKVRTLGAYRFSPSQLVEARILSSAGYPRISVLDVPYNVVRRTDFTDDLRLVASAQGIAVTPSHALEHGFLAGSTRTRADAAKSVRGSQKLDNLTKRGTRTLRALDAIAEELAVPTAAVAVAWLLAQKVIAAPIVSIDAPSQIHELVQGVGIKLNRGQLADIARASQ